MNINIFEKSQTETKVEGETSFVDEQALSIKQKIESRKNKQKKIKTIFGVLIFLIVIFAAATAYSQYKLYTLTKEEMAVPQVIGTNASSTDKTAITPPKTGPEVIAALKRHILVPNGDPQIAEVQDAAKLRETQAFFKDTRTGDIVIVYDTTIFIYRPSDDIVVASGDISGVGQVKP